MQTHNAFLEFDTQGIAETFEVLNSALSRLGDDAARLFHAANTPVESEGDLLLRAELMDFLMDMAKSEQDICMVYAHAISDRIEEYEAQRDMPKIPAAEVLKEMMLIRGVRQKDLAQIATQSTISSILNGKRSVTAQQAKAFGEFFNLPVERFID